MPSIRRAVPGDAARWDAFVRAQADSHFGQTMAWLDLTRETYGVPAEHWLAEEDGAIRGVLPLFRKGGRSPNLFSAPGGLLAGDGATAAALPGIPAVVCPDTAFHARMPAAAATYAVPPR